MLKRFWLILSLAIGMVLLAVLPTLAESVDTAWVRRYNGPANDYDAAKAIAVDDSGNVYVTGYSEGSGTGYDYTTIKYYPDGDTAWVRRYNGPANDYDAAKAIAVDDLGNVYVTGYSEDSGTGYDYTTIKYYSNGDTAWVSRYNGPGNGDDEARAIAVDDSGNVSVTGTSGTIKHDSQGEHLWIGSWGGRDVAVDGYCNVYVMGESGLDYATMKYYPNGDTAWMRTYNGLGNGIDYAYAISVDGSGNVYVTGRSHGIGTHYDYATIKYYPNGDTAWVRTYNGPGNSRDEARDIAVDSSGNVYVTGTSNGDIETYYTADYATIKYFPNGDTAWIRRYNGSGNWSDKPTALAGDGFGSISVTGWSGGSSGTYNLEYVTIKYCPNGDTGWIRTHNCSGNLSDVAFAIAVDASGNVYVTGTSDCGNGTDNDFTTIKYVQTGTDVKDETGDRERPSEFTLSQNYPNPFNQTTKIEFTLAKSGFVSLNIYDILGRKVRTLGSEHLSSGYKSVFWDGKNESGKDVASGIYFYQMKVEGPASGGVGDFTETKKLVLLK